MLKNQGTSNKVRYYHEMLGYNYRMTNLQAAIGCAQMERIDEFIKKQRYYSELSNKKKNIVKAVASPCWTFFKLYFIKLGFLDGWHGYIIAKIYAKYTFWKYSK